MSASIGEEVHEDEGGAALNNASVTARTVEQQVPAKVHAAARKLADVIKGANVKDINSMINKLTCQTDSSAIFNFRELSRGSLLHIAAATGKSDILGLLLEHVDANLIAAKDDWWNTPLHIATKAKAHEVADMLIHKARNLSSGEDNNWILRRKNKHGNAALHEAVLTRDAHLVSHLLSIELEPVYWENVDRKSPLYLALDAGNSKIFRILLSYSLDPSRIEGLPPIHGVVAREQYDLLDEILKKNMKLFTMTDAMGGNIFHLAAFWNVPQVFKHLQLETEYLARERDSNGDLPIHIASKRGHVAIIEKLHGVSRWVNGQGQTILHVAAKHGREKAVRYILRPPDLREMINERDHDGNTPSHLAVKYLQPAALLHLVLDERMNPYLLNHERLAIVDCAPYPARRGFRPRMVRILLQSMSAKRSDLTILKPEARDKEYANISLINTRGLRENINTLLLVATLVTTVTFTAGFTVPGGLNSSDRASKDDRGMATMLDDKMFQDFVFYNSIAMFCSMTSVVFFMLAYLTEVHFSIFGCLVAGVLLAISLPTMSYAFLIGVTLTVGKLPELANGISFFGDIFILIITGALLSPMVFDLALYPFVIRRLRPIRPLVSWFILAFLCFFKVETTIISDDSKEDQRGIKTSASPPLDGGGED
ncbi:hypothetical protein BT93_L0016 [Corymbia citriodora subsp. variegata]|uniref:PGG domain-containing protein n=1 Tax=Corymbia citriodora subsp. variegata TaxID=360336 RepID=A0A8T0CUM6_CORYI|nr:hypothetical protein BT93_L0016 [Corymbia citriodora subsp. variegata]